MIHFFYLTGFALFVGVCFGVFSTGTLNDKIFYGIKTFAQFIVISIVLAWLFYFTPR
jgi:hypothetical protein